MINGNLLNVNCVFEVPLWVGQHNFLLTWKFGKPNSNNKMASLVNTEQEYNGAEYCKFWACNLTYRAIFGIDFSVETFQLPLLPVFVRL